MSEDDAANLIKGSHQAPSQLDLFTQNQDFPQDQWASVAGQHVSTLGDRPGQPATPTSFAKAWDSVTDATKARLTSDPNAGPLQARQILDDAATIGRNISTPGSRNIPKTAASGLAVEGLTAGLTEAATHAVTGGHWGAGGAVGVGLPPTIAYLLARRLESPEFKAAMAGQGPSLAEGVYKSMPGIASTTTQQDYSRLAASPALQAYQGTPVPGPDNSPQANAFRGVGLSPPVPRVMPNPPPVPNAPGQRIINVPVPPQFPRVPTPQ
jgi:hypothetical protein